VSPSTPFREIQAPATIDATARQVPSTPFRKILASLDYNMALLLEKHPSTPFREIPWNYTLNGFPTPIMYIFTFYSL
jgi:hypothetical protein